MGSQPKTKTTTLVWFTNALRLADHPALHRAAARGPVAAVYVLDPAMSLGGAAKWWLHRALESLAADLSKHHVHLILKRGDPAKILPALAKEVKADAVSWQRRYEPAHNGDRAVEAALNKAGIEAEPHTGWLLFDPAGIATKSGTPFKVYGPFSRACLKAAALDKPLPAPDRLHGIKGPIGDRLADWRLYPRKSAWPKGLDAAWEVSEEAAAEHLHDFLADIVTGYPKSRDIPGSAGTSRLSPYLHHGLIGARQAWHAAIKARGGHAHKQAGVERFVLELLWREFNWHMLQAVPDLPQQPLDRRFEKFKWRRDAKALRAWQRGLTGYPIVDAGMRQLWRTGWMHNRVRMITASFLIKDLLVDWKTGMDWFWDCLVDADLANNTGNWQWVAGCGADASPFFRIFNPVTQSRKFDADGRYIREFVPELARLEARHIHAPWEAPQEVLAEAGLILGKDYPKPIVDHDAARQRALAALKAVTRRNAARPGSN